MATMSSPFQPLQLPTTTAQPQSPPPPITTKPNQIDPITGNLLQPTGTAVTGGNAPVQTVPGGTPFPQLPTNQYPGLGQLPTGIPAYNQSMTPANVIQDITGQLLSNDGAYMRNARLRGIEQAQRRGLGNSSIAAGNSQRAAIEAVQPFVSEAASIFNRRENEAFQGEQTIREQMFTALENQRDRDQQITMSQVQNWLNDQTFNREFNAQLSLLPISSAANLQQMLAEYGLKNPQVWTPEVLDGVGNFFNNSFLNILRNSFPQYYGG